MFKMLHVRELNNGTSLYVVTIITIVFSSYNTLFYKI